MSDIRDGVEMDDLQTSADDVEAIIADRDALLAAAKAALAYVETSRWATDVAAEVESKLVDAINGR